MKPSSILKRAVASALVMGIVFLGAPHDDAVITMTADYQ